MSDRDDVPYIVIEKESGAGLGSFLLGAAVGAGLALLFAPKSGAETQAELKAGAERLRGAAEVRLKEAQESIEQRLEQARVEVRARVDAAKDAFESGREAAGEAREELEQKIQRSKAAYRAGIRAAQDVAAQDPPADEAPEAEEGDAA